MTEPLSKQLLKGARRALRWVGRKGANSESSVTPELRSSGAQLLFEHTNQFSTAEVIEVTEGVHVAIGYGLANSVLIEGTDGVIIVDTLESDEAARPVKEAFVAITDAPVVRSSTRTTTLITSLDRVRWRETMTEVYAHETTREHITKIVSVVRPAIFTRSMRQFGVFLPPGDHLNSGLALACSSMTRRRLVYCGQRIPSRTLEDKIGRC